MKFAFVLFLLIAQGQQAHAGWGLNDDAIVKDCASRAQGPREEFRGKSSQSDGSIIIYNIDKKKTVMWAWATQESNDVIEEKMDFRHTLFATFLVYPMEKDTPGQQRQYCVQRLRNVRWQTLPRPKI